jgi:DNA-binding IclR family transcriptional regulator
VSRPALSTSRSLEIIELFTNFPDRSFTFSEIFKATKINNASCHAILNALTSKGYLLRSEAKKTYQLGPSLIAAGRVAQQSYPLFLLAERAARALFDEVGVPVLLSSQVGDEILAVISIQDESGHDAGMRGGERLPLIPPLGVPFLAWATKEEIEAWLARRPAPLPAASRDVLMRQLELTRQHGYHLHMRSETAGISNLIGEMSKMKNIGDYKNVLNKTIYAFSNIHHEWDNFDQEKLYSPQLISAPIFDRSGNAAFNLVIGGFSEGVTGKQMQEYVDRLSKACLDVMRSDRAQPSRDVA